MKFAHLSDIHLGYQKNEKLQKKEQQVFEEALNRCISYNVDFILMPGDIFHVNIPEMRIQKYAFAMFRKVHEAGIPIYVVYGSHDFSPVSNSVIDLLNETGYITKVTKATSNNDDTITLDFLIDQKTGTKITGLSGLKAGKDREWYEKLDRDSLETESGFKIFLFHGGVADMKTDTTNEGDLMPLSLLPKGFSYYAGGHMHKFNHQEFPDYSHVVYPGTLFAGYHADLEENARGQRRGFVLVEFKDKIESVKFEEIKNLDYEIIEIDADNRKIDSVNAELREKTLEIDPADKVVIIKIEGELTLGKTAQVDTSSIRNRLVESGSLAVNVSKNKLTSKEYKITEAKGANREEIETNVFAENIGQVHSEQKELLGEQGVKTAKKLLQELGQVSLVGEKKNEYRSRVCNNAMAFLGLDEE